MNIVMKQSNQSINYKMKSCKSCGKDRFIPSGDLCLLCKKKNGEINTKPLTDKELGIPEKFRDEIQVNDLF